MTARLIARALCVTALLVGAGCKKEGVFFQSMNPTAGKASGGEEVRIRGSGFRTLGGLEIRIGSRVATNVGVADDETIVLTTPDCREAEQGRKLDVHILTNEGRSIMLREAFTYRRAESTGGNSDLQRRL